MIRISRPCYNKFHRCPGWAGGGMRYAKVEHCDGGSLDPGDGSLYEGRFWKFRINRCSTCGVFVLPYVVRWLDWRWLVYVPERWWRSP